MLVKTLLGIVFFICLGLVFVTAPMANEEPMMSLITAGIALAGIFAGIGAITIKPGVNF